MDSESDDGKLSAIPERNVADLVEARLRHFIISSGLRSGDKLPSENALAVTLGVGRNAVREGLRSLQSLGMVEVHHGKGRFLKGYDFERVASGLAYSLIIDRDSLSDLLRVRRVLEVGFLDDAVRRLRQSDLRKLDTLVREMWKKHRSAQTFVFEDFEFHRALFINLRNRPLLSLLEVFWLLFKEVEENTHHSQAQLREAVVYHEKILDALKSDDVRAARSLLSEHLVDAESRIRAADQR